MYGMGSQELRRVLVISSSHFAQHVYYRILPPLIPVLAVALDYPLWQLGLLISLYSLGMGVLQAPLGILADRVDRRYLLPTGIGLAGAAYIVFGFAETLGRALPSVGTLGHTFEGDFLVMSVAMLAVGGGLAIVHPVGYPMITDNVTTGNKGKALGIFGASSKLGDGVTPAVIAGLILFLSWQQIIVLLGGVGLLYAVALFLAFRPRELETVPLRQRNARSGASTAGLRDLDRRTYLYPLTIIYFFWIGKSLTSRALTAFLPAFLVVVYAHSFDFRSINVGAESVANIYFAVLLISGAVMQLYLGSLTDEFDSRLVLLGCLALATFGMIALATLTLHPLALFVIIVILGTGMFGLNPARDALISDLSPAEYEGRTFGYLFTAVTLTGSMLPTVIGYVLEVAGMRQGYLVLAVGTLIAACFIALLYSDRVYLDTSRVRTGVDTSD